jgi:hypothetical protein
VAFCRHNNFRKNEYQLVCLDLHHQKTVCHIFCKVGWVTLVRLTLPSATQRLTGCGGSSRVVGLRGLAN